MILGIDASNLRGGGGLTHLVELLRAADPVRQGFSRVIVWGSRTIWNRIEDRPWLVKSDQPLLQRGLLYRAFWQCFRLSGVARRAKCQVVFVPGGFFAGDFQPTVAMSQNLLPFERLESARFGWSRMGLKLRLLRMMQARTFRRADGVVFLTRYASDVVMNVIKRSAGRRAIVPHGVQQRFVCPPRRQLALSSYSRHRPLRLLYVSTVDMYKHQWHVAEAVAQLYGGGLPVRLDLVGPAYPAALRRLKRTLGRVDPQSECVRYAGAVPYSEMHSRYAQADVCLFASTCENMPIILLEAMASGLPIVCSNRGPMPSLLDDGGLYCNPESPTDIADALRRVAESPELRTRMARAAFERAQRFSWAQCAEDTFGFLAGVATGRHLTHV